jgi:hypothetical protein
MTGGDSPRAERGEDLADGDLDIAAIFEIREVERFVGGGSRPWGEGALAEMVVAIGLVA